MSNMALKSGEVISIASGIFEGYDSEGPFTVVRDFYLEAFVGQAKAVLTKPWGVSKLMHEIPRMLFAQGLISIMPCRKIYLGGEIELGEGKNDY